MNTFSRQIQLNLVLVVALALALAACSPDPAPSSALNNSRPGEYAVADVFQPFYKLHGGRGVLGQAITPLVVENGIQVQYLLNARLEYHPGNPESSRVILSPLGVELGFSQPPVPPDDPRLRYFDVTGHILYPEFEPFFEGLGGVAFFGYPVSEITSDGDRLIQFFERAVILKPKDAPAGDGIRLGALGHAAYPYETGITVGRDVTIDLPATGMVEHLRTFVNTVVRGDILGPPRTNPYLRDDGTWEQVYENAILYEDPTAPAGARLRALGMAHHPDVDLTAPPRDSGCLYFPATGHNVCHRFLQHFRDHGGLAVFGLPLSEAELEEDMLVQYFENVRMEWHFDASGDQAFRLTPYGRESLSPSSQATPPPTPNPDLHMILKVWAEWPTLPAGSPQTVHVLVLDTDGQPIPGVNIVLAVHLSSVSFSIYSAPTDTSGHTQVTFSLENSQAGKFVIFDVAATAPGRPPASQTDSFYIWFGKASPN